MLNQLTRQKNITSFSISPENPTGEKGKGAAAVDGIESHSARELGIGWKISPFLRLAGGETALLADVKGQGAIKHFWITDSAKAGRLLILRIYFDSHPTPAVEAPLGDFFCSADLVELNNLIASKTSADDWIKSIVGSSCNSTE